jgi:hypothetical protein
MRFSFLIVWALTTFIGKATDLESYNYSISLDSKPFIDNLICLLSLFKFYCI